MHRSFARGLLVVGLGLSLPVFAWGPEGHETVGLIAEQHLTPEARAAVDTILAGEHLGDLRVCCWADFIRGNKQMGRVYPDNNRWHYIDLAVDGTNTTLVTSPDGQDVVSQVERWTRELADPETTPDRRRDALRFLVHFLGDMHQPLHCGDRGGDRGGNLVPVTSFQGDYFAIDLNSAGEDRPNLHRTWDEYLVYETMAGLTVTQFAANLSAQLTPDQLAAWTDGTPRTWAWATHQLAVSNAYRLADDTPLPRPESGTPLRLTQDNYITARLPLVNEQLQKAGLRLARLLNETFSPRPASAPAPTP